MKSNLIVGAGLSGAVLASLIADKLNEEVLVIDRKEHIAGNIYDYKDKETNITIHKYGPHIFHTNNKKVWDYLSKYTKWNFFFLKPNVIIEGNCVTLPFNLTLISTYGYGAKVPILKLRENPELEFIAQYIYENVFKNYTSKQWGLEPDKIDPSVTARVPIYISFDNRYFQDKYQGIPLFGYTKMVENILKHKNIKVKLNTDFKEITQKFDRVIYCGAIDEYFDYKFGQLPYRSLNFDIQTINQEYYQKTVVVNYPNNYDFTRICEHKYFLNEKSSKTVISVEYPQSFELGKNERYYPIANDENLALYKKYKDESQKIDGLYFLGRLGDYKYYNMDLAVERVFEFFDKELK